MGVLGVFFGCRGDGGFNGRCSGASIGDGGFTLVCISGCRGVIGFDVVTSQLPVREKVRPAWSKWHKFGVLWLAGRTFSRLSTRGPVAGRVLSRGEWGSGVLGEFCRVCRHGSHVSQVRRRPTCRKWWGVLHDMKPSGCVSPACRSLMSCNSPDWCLSVRGAVPKVQTVAAKNVEEGLPRFVLAGTRAD